MYVLGTLMWSMIPPVILLALSGAPTPQSSALSTLTVNGTSHDAVKIHNSTNESDIRYTTAGGANWQVGTNKVNAAGVNQFYIFDTTYRLVVHTGTGNVGIGTQNPSKKLEVAGEIGATGFFYTSDARLKKDVTRLDASLAKILQLEAVSYRWKDDRQDSGNKEIGLLAQDVARVFPEIVDTDPMTGQKSLQYGKLVAPLIEAVKTLNDENLALKGAVYQLSDRYEALAERITQLESRQTRQN